MVGAERDVVARADGGIVAEGREAEGVLIAASTPALGVRWILKPKAMFSATLD